MVSWDKFNSQSDRRPRLYTHESTWRDWQSSILPSRLVKQPAYTQRGGSAIVTIWKRVCVVTHVRWGTGVPRDPVPWRNSPPCGDPHQTGVPFVQRRSIHIRSNLMDLSRKTARERYDLDTPRNQVVNKGALHDYGSSSPSQTPMLNRR